MNSKRNSIAEWDFSTWFVLLSPVIGIYWGFRGIPLSSLKGDAKMKTKNLGQSNATKSRKWFQRPRRWHGSDACVQHVDLQFGKGSDASSIPFCSVRLFGHKKSNYAGYMLARHIKPNKIVFHGRLLPHQSCRMKQVQHAQTKKRFLVFSASAFMTDQPQM